MSKRLRVVFTLSLLLNIIFIAAAVGLFYHRFGEDVPPLPSEMSPQARQFLERTFKEGREQIRPLIDDVRAERETVEDVLTSETFDSKAYETAVARMLDAREKIARKRADITGKALADLPVEDRRKFADKILDGLEGKRPPKGGFHGRMMKGAGPEQVPAAPGEPAPKP